MRISVELEESLLQEVMRLTGESKMSTAVAKAAELFANRKKAVEIIRSLREEPMDYGLTNDEVEGWGEDPKKKATKRVSHRKKGHGTD